MENDEKSLILSDKKGMQGDLTNANKEKRRLLILRQDNFINAFVQSCFNVSRACRKVAISRRTYYSWMNNDDGMGSYATDENGLPILFAERVCEAEDEKLDFVEEKLHQRIIHGDTVATMFYLETKGSERGYSKNQRIDIKYENITKEQKDAAVKAMLVQADGSMLGIEGNFDIVQKLIEDSKKHNKSENIIDVTE